MAHIRGPRLTCQEFPLSPPDERSCRRYDNVSRARLFPSLLRDEVDVHRRRTCHTLPRTTDPPLLPACRVTGVDSARPPWAGERERLPVEGLKNIFGPGHHTHTTTMPPPATKNLSRSRSRVRKYLLSSGFDPQSSLPLDSFFALKKVRYLELGAAAWGSHRLLSPAWRVTLGYPKLD